MGRPSVRQMPVVASTSMGTSGAAIAAIGPPSPDRKPVFVDHDGEILEWIAVDDQQVRQVPFLDLPQLAAEAHDLAAHFRAALQGFARRITQQIDEMLKIAGVGALRGLGKTVIAPDDHPDAALAQFRIDAAAVVDDPLHTHGDGRFLGKAEGSTVVDRAIDDADGRADEDSVLDGFQHVERLFVGGFAVIDDIDAAAHRTLDRFRRPGMAIHPLAEIAGHLDGGRHFALAHDGQAAMGHGPEIIAGDVDLYVVDAFPAAQAHNARHVIGTVGDHAEALVVHVVLAFVAQARSDGDLRAGSANARPR